VTSVSARAHFLCVSVCVSLAVAMHATPVPAQQPPAQEKGAAKPLDPSDAFFKKGEIPRLKIELTPEAIEKLKANPREYVPCRIHENEKTVYEGVSLKLKGSAGSFRDFDDKPALTLRMNREDGEERFHGLAKFHLNNSVQDDTYLREWLGSELFRAAGVATPRVTHARVWLNDRDVGFFVLKEGFDKHLVKRQFENPGGNLYDGGFCQDLDADLNKECGKGPDDRSDLKALREACQEPDLAKRWPRVAELVDVKAFLTFMTMELMAGHWDGYCQNRNNFRLYFDAKTKKALFLAHGMDQIFQDANAPILDMPCALVAVSVMKNPEWRTQFRKRIVELLPLFDAIKLNRKVDEVNKRIEAALATMNRDGDADPVKAHEEAVHGLKSLIEEREKFLVKQRAQPDPRPLVFTLNTPVRIDSWKTMSESEDATVGEKKVAGEKLFVVACGKSGQCVAGYRRSVLLAKGRYRLQASLQVKDVAPLINEEATATPTNVGAGVRISGATRDAGLTGTTPFKTVQFEFDVEETERDIELIVELRASKGTLQIRPESLKLTRLSGSGP
jgi:spore coat protein H